MTDLHLEELRKLNTKLEVLAICAIVSIVYMIFR